MVEVDLALSGRDRRARHVIVVQRKLPPEQNVVKIDERTPEDPTRVSILVGEVLQCLRSALDHLVGELERKNGLTRDSGFEFPIFWDLGLYKRQARRLIKGVSAEAATLIERCQPYHRAAPSYKDHPLWILHDLNNADKHRILIETGASIRVDNLDISLEPGTSREIVLAVSSEHRLDSMPRPERATGERWTLIATFAQFGQRSGVPIIPGLLELQRTVTQIVLESRAA